MSPTWRGVVSTQITGVVVRVEPCREQVAVLIHQFGHVLVVRQRAGHLLHIEVGIVAQGPRALIGGLLGLVGRDGITHAGTGGGRLHAMNLSGGEFRLAGHRQPTFGSGQADGGGRGADQSGERRGAEKKITTFGGTGRLTHGTPGLGHEFVELFGDSGFKP